MSAIIGFEIFDVVVWGKKYVASLML